MKTFALLLFTFSILSAAGLSNILMHNSNKITQAENEILKKRLNNAVEVFKDQQKVYEENVLAFKSLREDLTDIVLNQAFIEDRYFIVKNELCEETGKCAVCIDGECEILKTEETQ